MALRASAASITTQGRPIVPQPIRNMEAPTLHGGPTSGLSTAGIPGMGQGGVSPSTSSLARTLPTGLAEVMAARDDKDSAVQSLAPEGQWMLAVLEDVISKISAISFLSEDVLKDKIMDVLDKRVAFDLQTYFEVEADYAAALHQIQTHGTGQGDKQFELGDLKLAGADKSGGLSSVLSGLLGAEDLDDDEAKAKAKLRLTEQEQLLTDTVRTISRTIEPNIPLLRRLREISSVRPGGVVSFVSTISRLRQVIKHRLGMTHDEDVHTKQQLALVKAQIAKAKQLRLEKSRQISQYTRDRALLLSQKDQQINKVKEQLAALSAEETSKRDALVNNSRAKRENIESSLDQEGSMLTETLGRLNERLDTEGGDRWAQEVKAQRQKDLKETNVATKIAEYDETMAAKHKHLEKLLILYEKETREVHKLETYFAHRDREDQRAHDEMQRILDTRNRELAVERLRRENELFIGSLVDAYDERKERAVKLALKKEKEKQKGGRK